MNETIEQPVVEQQEEPTLRETLERVIETTPDETTESAPSDTSRERDERGRFTQRAPAGSEVPSEDEVKAASEPLPAQELEPHLQEAPNLDNAPKSWKSSTRQKWANLDPEVRAEVHRRERETTRALNESAPVRKFAQQFQEVIQPHADRYRQTGMPPLQVVQNLMNADALLSSAPMPQRAKFMAKLISDYGIDIRTLDSALAGEEPQARPLDQVESLINQKLAPIQEFVQTAQQGRQQAMQREYSEQERHIAAMSADSSNFPHFDLVALEMADIMEVASRRQVYLTPEEAYKRAVAMNPEAQAAERGRAGQQRAQVAHDAATRSLGASLSVSGSSAGLKQTVAPDDLRSTIEAAWAAHQGR